MRNRSLILLATALVIVFVGVTGVYAYDHTGRGTIADGVTIAGVDVGGLDAEQARARLERTYVPQLRTPIVVSDGDASYTLDASESKAAANLSAMVDRALAEGRDDSVFARTWRRVAGKELDVDVEPNTIYDADAADRFIDEVRAGVDRAAHDASVKFSADGIESHPGEVGKQVRVAELRRMLDHAIVDPRAQRSFVVPAATTQPAVTSAEVEQKYKTALIVNRENFTLALYRDLKRVKTYHVAVGAVGLETPAGIYHIQNKAINPAWTKPYSDWVKPSERGDVVPGGTPQNPLKARWLGIFDGAGIHGIDPSEYGSIGHAASHGCVRMKIPDVIDLYDRVDVGTPIYID